MYNNVMFTLQGHFTELLAGTTWEQLVQTEIYDKVNLLCGTGRNTEKRLIKITEMTVFVLLYRLEW